MNWREIPFIRLSGPFALGIWIYFQQPGYLAGQAWMALLILPAVLLWFTGKWYRLKRKESRLLGIMILLLMASMGVFTARQSDVRRSPFFVGRIADGTFGGAVVEGKGRRLTLNLRVVRPETASSWQVCRGRLLVYLPDTLHLSPGDTVLVSGRISRIQAPLNPNAFDFRRYLAGKGVYFQLFAGADKLVVKARSKPPLHIRWRQSCLAVLERHLQNPDAFAVGAALIFGYRGSLDESLRQAYSASGAMHILAVSGLHVGLVYTGLGVLLGCFPAGRTVRRYGVPLLQLVGIWVFVAMAGLAPSAIRAAVMCSFFTLGRMADRSGHPLNTLAASAFCMLLVQPRLLFDVGFQLSYSAVAGILVFERSISQLWNPLWRPAAYFWKMTAVSLAAQLATFPLSIYYFHQFPSFFLLSGFFAIPAASLILGGGLLLLPFQLFPPLAGLLGISLDWLICLVNEGMRFIAQLPGSQVSGIWMDNWSVLLYFVLLLSLVVLWPFSRAGSWYLMGALLLLIGLRRIAEQARQEQQVEVVAYSLPGHTLLDFVEGSRAWTAADSGVSEKDLARTAAPFRWSRGVQVKAHWNLDQFPAEKPLAVSFHGLRIIIVGPACRLEAVPSQPADVVLIRGSPEWSPEKMLRRVEAPLLLFDASCPGRQVERWKDLCKSLGKNCRDIRREGAWHISLNPPTQFKRR